MLRASLVGIGLVAASVVVGCGGVALSPGPKDGDAERAPSTGGDAGAGTGGADADASAAVDADASGADAVPESRPDAGSDVSDAGAADTGGADAGGTQFIVRVTVTTIGADGFSTIPVIVLGTDAMGNPSNAKVVLGVSRAGVGTVSPSTLTLGQAGGMATYTVCNAASSSVMCLGKVRITLALASAPTEILAQSQEINLVIPEGVGSPAPCLVGGNVLYFNGDASNYIFKGMQTVTKATWQPTVSSTQVHIHLTPSDTTTQGLWWDLYFDSSKLGMPLMTQVYKDAMRWPFQTDGHPGLDVSGDGRGCNMVTGRFEIQDLVMSNGALTKFTATFEHHCEGLAAALRGCVHIEM
jgi:hypothetical protein